MGERGNRRENGGGGGGGKADRTRGIWEGTTTAKQTRSVLWPLIVGRGGEADRRTGRLGRDDNWQADANYLVE